MGSKSEFEVPFQTKSDTIPTPTHQSVGSSSYLNVSTHPPPPLRRPSHASIVSDISDLDYMSNDHQNGLLGRTISNVSGVSTFSDSGSVTIRQRLQSLYYQNYGALLVLLSQIFGSGMNVATRLLEQPGAHGAAMHPFQILFTRQSLTAILCTTYALTTKSIPYFPLGPPDRKVRLLLVSRGLCGFLGVFGMYFSLLYLPLSEATVLTFLAPILTCYLCSLVLSGETFTRQQQIAGFVSFIGVIFIAHPFTLFSGSHGPPPTSHDVVDGTIISANMTTASDPMADHDPNHPTPSQHLLAIGIAMIGVCGATGAMTSIRAIGTRAHAFISINYFSVWSVIVSLLALIFIPGVSFRFPSNLIEWGLLLSLGICGFIMQGLLTMGLAYGGPTLPSNTKPTIPSPTDRSNAHHTMRKATDEDIEMQPHLPHSLPRSSSPTPSNGDPSRAAIAADPLSSLQRRHKSKSRPHPSGNRATSMVYTQMLFALAADKVIFGTTLGIWSWLGSGLILSGAVWVAAAKDGTRVAKHNVSRTRDGSGDDRRDRHPDGSGNGDGDGHVREERTGLLAAGSNDHDDNDTNDYDNDDVVDRDENLDGNGDEHHRRHNGQPRKSSASIPL